MARGQAGRLAPLMVGMVVAACAPAVTPPGTDMPPPSAPSPTLVASPTPNAAFAAFSLRVSAASADHRDLVLDFAAAAADGDLEAAGDALEQLDAWAEREDEWLTANPPEGCWRLAHDAFSAALAKVGHAVRSLRWVVTGLVDADAAEIESRADDLLEAGDQLEHAVAVANESVCSASDAPEQPLARSFKEVVADVNGRYGVLDGDPESVDYVLAFLALQEELAEELARLATSMPGSSGIVACQTAAESVVYLLRSAAAEASPESMKSGLVIAAFGVLEQREKCATVRAFEGMPPPRDRDLI